MGWKETFNGSSGQWRKNEGIDDDEKGEAKGLIGSVEEGRRREKDF